MLALRAAAALVVAHALLGGAAPGVAQPAAASADGTADVAPTPARWIGLPVPEGLDGRALF